jgi:hypothetical protein
MRPGIVPKYPYSTMNPFQFQLMRYFADLPRNCWGYPAMPFSLVLNVPAQRALRTLLRHRWLLFRVRRGYCLTNLGRRVWRGWTDQREPPMRKDPTRPMAKVFWDWIGREKIQTFLDGIGDAPAD